MKEIFTNVFLAPAIAAMFSIPIVLGLGEIGFFDDMTQWESGFIGIVAAGIGLIIGKVIEFQYS